MAHKCPFCSHENPEDTRFCGHCATPLKQENTKFPSPTRTLPLLKSDLIPGTDFAGRYQIQEELGVGGMGRVFKVFDKKIGEILALKLLNPEVGINPKNIIRFQNELKLARRISHKNVCRVYHLSESDDLHYITMEFIEGRDLKTIIGNDGSFSPTECLRVAGQLLEGLFEAHNNGVIHRDLKPQNIMVTESGSAVIMDFGIAHTKESRGITETGLIIGTPDYMAPEQIEGEAVDCRTDIYALGIILFEMLAGELPYKGDTAYQVAFKHKTHPIPDVRDRAPAVPRELSMVIRKCMDKNPKQRYQNVEALKSDLARLTGAPQQDSIPEPRKKLRQGFPGLARTRKKAMAGILAFVTLGLVFLGTRKLILVDRIYDDIIRVDISTEEIPNFPESQLDFMIARALRASTRYHVLLQKDYTTYKTRTKAAENTPRNRPEIELSLDAWPKVTGFDVSVTLKHKRSIAKTVFDCRGPFDLLTRRIDDIHTFIAENSDGAIGPIEGNRLFSGITTSHQDAFNHFLRGEEAWGSLEKNEAKNEFQTAVEIDPEFALARLRLAEVLDFFFGAEKAGIAAEIDAALTHPFRLLTYDILRLQALKAKLANDRNEERRHLIQLVEAFPFHCEYHYFYAESYFHAGEASEAIKHYTSALAIDPNYNYALNHIGYCYAWKGEHDRALEYLLKYNRLDPKPNSFDSLAAIHMFAGKYEEALQAVQEGLKIDDSLDYLYGNAANILLFNGRLAAAERSALKSIELAETESSKTDGRFRLAYIDFLRGDPAAAQKKLDPVLAFYSDRSYANNLDETPNQPFWLAGVLAAERGDLNGLLAQLRPMEEKINRGRVNTANYFRILKFYNHLKALEGRLRNDRDLVLDRAEQGIRMQEKMGYWGSMFNRAFFFNAYAEIFYDLSDRERAREFLESALEYTPDFPPALINLAGILIAEGDSEQARSIINRARQKLSGADSDFIHLRHLDELEGLSDAAKFLTFQEEGIDNENFF